MAVEASRSRHGALRLKAKARATLSRWQLRSCLGHGQHLFKCRKTRHVLWGQRDMFPRCRHGSCERTGGLRGMDLDGRRRGERALHDVHDEAIQGGAATVLDTASSGLAGNDRTDHWRYDVYIGLEVAGVEVMVESGRTRREERQVEENQE